MINWYNVCEWGIEGKGWLDTEGYFDRLPARAKGVVRDNLWNLSLHTAGMLTRFETDSSQIWVRWTLRSKPVCLEKMPFTSCSGMDLYAQDDTGKWRYAGITCFNSLEEIESKWPTLEHNLVDVPLKPSKRMYMLNLPLYNGVSDVQIGVENGAYFRGVQSRQEKPIVFYGTSITHGCCASRPGINFVSILGRRLDMPVLNLGFAGEAFMDIEIAQLLNELDPSVYVIDCLPNMIEKMVQERCEPFIKEIRNSHPQTPIVLVEDRTATNAIFLPEQQERHRTSRRALRQAYENLLKAGIERLTYIEGERLLGNDGEGAVDGSHPTDLGFMRMADAFEPVLRNLTACKS